MHLETGDYKVDTNINSKGEWKNDEWRRPRYLKQRGVTSKPWHAAERSQPRCDLSNMPDQGTTGGQNSASSGKRKGDPEGQQEGREENKQGGHACADLPRHNPSNGSEDEGSTEGYPPSEI